MDHMIWFLEKDKTSETLPSSEFIHQWFQNVQTRFQRLGLRYFWMILNNENDFRRSKKNSTEGKEKKINFKSRWKILKRLVCFTLRNFEQWVTKLPTVKINVDNINIILKSFYIFLNIFYLKNSFVVVLRSNIKFEKIFSNFWKIFQKSYKIFSKFYMFHHFIQ